MLLAEYRLQPHHTLMADISGQDVLNQHSGQLYTKWVLQLKEFIHRRDCTHLDTTKHSVQFHFQDIIDVDLLVCP